MVDSGVVRSFVPLGFVDSLDIGVRYLIVTLARGSTDGVSILGGISAGRREHLCSLTSRSQASGSSDELTSRRAKKD